MSNLEKHLEEATEIVGSWPKWKREVLRKQSAPVSFSTHENDGEFVLRVHRGDSFVSLGVLNSQEEAELVCRSLNFVCSDWASNASIIKQAWEEYLQ